MTQPLVAVSSEIGRGHPAYLDSVLTALVRLGLGTRSKLHDNRNCVGRSTVMSPSGPECLKLPELCRGFSGLPWKAARAGYRFGALGGPATWLYNRLRAPTARPSRLQLSLLGSGLRRRFAGYEGVCVVDHPLLAHILARVCRVAYVHGETAAPCMAAVPEAWRTFVPLDQTGRKLEACGLKPEALSVTGLIIEPQLVGQSEAAYTARLQRLSSSDNPLTIAFFTSGAYPRPHVSQLLRAAVSVVRAGHRAVLFWGTGWLKAVRVKLALERMGIAEPAATVVWSRDRQGETTRTAELFPQLDVMVAAAHERTNWAVGLGLPMFVLLPHIGPFARENFEFAQQQGVCLPLSGRGHDPIPPGELGSCPKSEDFGTWLTELRRVGQLVEMSRNGWGKHSITGAEAAARILLQAVRS